MRACVRTSRLKYIVLFKSLPPSRFPACFTHQDAPGPYPYPYPYPYHPGHPGGLGDPCEEEEDGPGARAYACEPYPIMRDTAVFACERIPLPRTGTWTALARHLRAPHRRVPPSRVVVVVAVPARPTGAGRGGHPAAAAGVAAVCRRGAL